MCAKCVCVCVCVCASVRVCVCVCVQSRGEPRTPLLLGGHNHNLFMNNLFKDHV